MKKIMLPVLLFTGLFSYSQTCTVVPDALKGTYEGDCKNNKAEGSGKATGEDSYTGEFKNGYPEGKGQYFWKNGDWYEGQWKKGQREGQGTMHYKSANGKDSMLTGFWKKDKYFGLYEKPYIIHSKTPDINRADVTVSKNSVGTEIKFSIESIRGGFSGSTTDIVPKISITNMDIVSGQYLNKIDNDNLPKTFMSTLKDIQFPFRARIYMGTDMLDIEFLEKGSYSVDIKILK
jgi:hypothetical protein